MIYEIRKQEGHRMIVMDIQLDNFMAFKNFHMNMSYPKKIVNSYIEEEFLRERPNFRYKKVNILMGANASGKTSFGRMLMNIFNFMDKKGIEKTLDAICDTSQEARFCMDFITNDEYSLYRINTRINPRSGEKYQNSDIHVSVKKVGINIKDSYESCCKRLDEIHNDVAENFLDELEKIKGLSWLFEYPMDSGDRYKIPEDGTQGYVDVLENTLRALDPSIAKVEKVDSVKNTFVLRMKGQDVIIQDGKIIKTDILSSGTKAGIAIANILTAIINGNNGFYYCDEKFSYIHTDVEKAFLTVMIQCLKSNDQLFFTTHNTDILDLQLPKHSFIFLRKDNKYEDETIKCVCASDYIKRNTDSLRSAVDNDLFSVAPSVEFIYEIGEMKINSKEDDV